MEIKFKRLHPEAKLPKQGRPEDAAFDVHCVEDVTLQPGETKLVTTGLQLADMPNTHNGDGLYIQVLGRGGVSSKGVFPIGGVVDSPYRGELKIILHNGNPPQLEFDFRPGANGKPHLTGKSVSFNKGDRIAQIAVIKIVNQVTISESESVTDTVRGASGFGSTGA